MYVCFKCGRSVSLDLAQYFSHLRVIHHVYSSSAYFQCAQIGCHRSFNQYRSYRRHLVGHAIDFEVEDGCAVQCTTEQCSAAQCSDSPSEIGLFQEEDCMKPFEEWELENEVKDRVALYIARLK